MAATPARTRIYLEAGRTKVFACAYDWPGWARSTKSEDAAIEALAGYAERYALVAKAAHVRFRRTHLDFEVIERLAGTGATDFGVPERPTAADSEPWADAAEADRQLRLLSASWQLFDEVVAGAPATLKKGPRGGGRDRDPIVAHVVEAERAYARTVGVRHKPYDPFDTAARDALRTDLVAALRDPESVEAPAKRWPTRYAVRRITWHVLDHLWEIEDKSYPDPSR